MSSLSAASSRVILKDTESWDAWLSYIKAIAVAYKVWDQCNPSLKEEERPKLEPPEEIISVKDAIKEYPEHWFNVRLSLKADWDAENRAYQSKLQALDLVAVAIRQSVDTPYQPFIIDILSPLELMLNLHKRFAPESDPTYKTKLRQQWRNLDRGLDRNTDIEKWLLNWESLYQSCKKARMPEAEDATNQFLEAISIMSPGFYETWALRVQDNQDIPFFEIMTRYKAHWKITHGRPAAQRGISKAAFSTWQGNEEAKPIEARNDGLERRPCPCGRVKSRVHMPWACWEIYEDRRPANYQPSPALKQKWEKAMKANPRWKAIVDKKRAAYAEGQGGTLAKEQANTTLDDEAFGFLTTNAVKIDTVMSTKIKDFEATTTPTEDRWVVDTGAQIHVCNNRSLFSTFKNVQSNVKVGDTETKVAGIGTVVIYGVNPTTGSAVKMNLFQTRANCIETIDGHRQIYKIYHDQKLSWLTQTRGFITQKASDLKPEMTFATKKSNQEPKSEASIELWHRRLGHIGKARIVKLAEMTEGITIASNPGKEMQYSKTKPLPQEEDAISTMTNGLSAKNWPQVLSMEEAQSELSIEMRMPMSIARITLNDDVENREQGTAPEAVNEEIQESRVVEQAQTLDSREETPRVPPLKETPVLPLTPASMAGPASVVEHISMIEVRDQEQIPGSFPMSPQRASPQRALSSIATIESTPHERSPTSLSSPDPINVIQSIEAEGGEGDQYDEDEAEIERQLQQEMQYTPTPEPEDRPTREISASIDESNIISGPRIRKPKADPDYTAYLSLDEKQLAEPPSLLYAFTTGITKKLNMQNRLHRDQMPPPPENWKRLKIHPFATQLKAAAEFEIETLKAKETFSQVALPNKKSTQILPLKWVFTYKFDADGMLEKFKARICVRGDLQWMSTEEKRAATLAVKTARAVFALVAAFDLDMIQRDVVTAFLNSMLESEVYTKCPPGFEALNQCWLLHRALYGLRMSPRLWQQEATKVLVKLGLTPVEEDPCIFTTKGIIVFFYVDDIIIVNHPKQAKEAALLDQNLKKQWELRELDASWFLNIRIIRDREQKKLWLCQDSYIESMAHKYNLVTERKIGSPLSIEPLVPYDGVASPQQIHGFQAKVGSAQYATTITRVDAAKATSKVAEFLTNPGPKHIDAVDRIIQYLYETRFWAIEYGIRTPNKQPRNRDTTLTMAAKSVEFASDASFGDHKDRKSSEGYICKLYGGPIDWKATKQKTVTTSTTEAELLALAEAGKTVQWWRRVLNALGFEPDHPLSIMCDNQQTVDLLTKEGAAMHTKLRHVDINRCWMKQEVSAGRVYVDWVPTAAMPADGLTKALTKQKQGHFRELVGMRDVGHMIRHMTSENRGCFAETA
ncbi:hypothetical protein AAEP93_010038 [Penicillium crustosum]